MLLEQNTQENVGANTTEKNSLLNHKQRGALTGSKSNYETIWCTPINFLYADTFVRANVDFIGYHQAHINARFF